MKVRFYCDVPPFFTNTGTYFLTASTAPMYAKAEGFKRLAFDVDLPPELCNGGVDVVAPAQFKGVTEE